MQYARWSFSFRFGTNSVAMLQLFGTACGTASVAILHLFGMDQARLVYDPTGVCTGLLDFRHMLGEHIFLEHGVRSLALLLCVVLVLHFCTAGTEIVCCRDCLRFRYGHPPLLKVVAPLATTIMWLLREHRLEGVDSEVDCSRHLASWLCNSGSPSMSLDAFGSILANVTSKLIWNCNRHYIRHCNIHCIPHCSRRGKAART